MQNEYYCSANYLEPSEVSRETYKSLGRRVEDKIVSRVTHFQPISEKLQQMIGARVPQGAVEKYQTYNNIALMLYAETTDIGSRIRGYQYIERYRFLLSNLSQEMEAAFFQHIYSVRHGEIYLIKEKCVKFLTFAKEVASHCGIENSFEIRHFIDNFDHAMGARLRERHRTTHFHEAPSIETRLLQAMSAMGYGEREQEIYRRITTIFIEARNIECKFTFGEEIGDKSNLYLLAADQEAAAMWSILGQSVCNIMSLEADSASAGTDQPL